MVEIGQRRDRNPTILDVTLRLCAGAPVDTSVAILGDEPRHPFRSESGTRYCVVYAAVWALVSTGGTPIVSGYSTVEERLTLAIHKNLLFAGKTAQQLMAWDSSPACFTPVGTPTR